MTDMKREPLNNRSKLKGWIVPVLIFITVFAFTFFATKDMWV